MLSFIKEINGVKIYETSTGFYFHDGNEEQLKEREMLEEDGDEKFIKLMIFELNRTGNKIKRDYQKEQMRLIAKGEEQYNVSKAERTRALEEDFKKNGKLI